MGEVTEVRVVHKVGVIPEVREVPMLGVVHEVGERSTRWGLEVGEEVLKTQTSQEKVKLDPLVDHVHKKS